MKRMMMTALAWATVSLAALAQTTVFGGNYRIPSILRLPMAKWWPLVTIAQKEAMWDSVPPCKTIL